MADGANTFGLVSSSKSKKKNTTKKTTLGKAYPGITYDERTVRCNWCMKTFPESKIIFDPRSDEEACPYCQKSGYLMDIGRRL